MKRQDEKHGNESQQLDSAFSCQVSIDRYRHGFDSVRTIYAIANSCQAYPKCDARLLWDRSRTRREKRIRNAFAVGTKQFVRRYKHLFQETNGSVLHARHRARSNQKASESSLSSNVLLLGLVPETTPNDHAHQRNKARPSSTTIHLEKQKTSLFHAFVVRVHRSRSDVDVDALSEILRLLWLFDQDRVLSRASGNDSP